MQPQRGGGRPSKLLDPSAIVAEQPQKTLRRLDALPRGFGHTAQEEIKPRFPFAALAHSLQVLIVGRAVLFEEQAEIQQRLAQHALLAHEKGNQQAAEAAVAVKKRVDRLE